MVYKDIEEMIPKVMKEKSGYEWKGCFVESDSFKLKII